MNDADTKALEKYLKIKALAERGEPGERENARKLLQRMERKHPWIKMEAARREVKEETPPEPDRPHWSDVWRQQQEARSWQEHLRNFGSAASGAFEWASQFAGQAFSVHEAQRLAQQHVKLNIKDNNTGSLSCNIRIPPAIAQRVYQQFTLSLIHI